MSARLRGQRQLGIRLSALEREVGDRLLLEAVTEGGEIIAEEAASRAPRETGALVEGIVVRARRTKRGNAIARIGYDNDVFYGTFQELGTRHHPARPHLRPAHAAKRTQALNRVRQILRRGVDRARRR